MLRSSARFGLGLLGLVAMTAAATAAVTVIGGGPAQYCYHVAEFGGSGAPRDAIGVCTRALDQQALSVRDRAATFVNRGIILAGIGETEAALRDYDEGLYLRPDMGEGYVDRGATLIALKRFPEALQDINRGIALNPNNLQIAYYNRAVVYEAMGKFAAAYADYKRAIQIDPSFVLASQQLTRFRVVRRATDGA